MCYDMRKLNRLDRGAGFISTVGQGQAAAPGERGYRRREAAGLLRFAWAVREYLPDCHSFVKRYRLQ